MLVWILLMDVMLEDTKKEVEEMDKKNLYYLVGKGSNRRIGTGLIKGEPLIGTKDALNREYGQREAYEIISVADYEKKFEDDKK